MIKPFTEDKQGQLKEFVLGIQNDEFGLGLSESEQPDLLATNEYYSGGGFWIEEIDDEIVGCIGLQKLNEKVGVLRKMFVKKALRGTKPKVAQRLFDRLMEEGEKLGFHTILLDTPAMAKASHRFYEKNGFREMDRREIPKEYKFPDRNSKVFKLTL